MKKGFYTVGLGIVLVIAGFAFVVSPAMLGSANNSKAPVFGSYGGKEIRYEQGSDFANYVQNQAQLYEWQHVQITQDDYRQIFSSAFYSVVRKLAYTQAVEKSGYTVPQAAVNRAMLPYFLDENGNYSQRKYRETPASEIEAMQKSFRESLTAERYTDDVFGSQTTFNGSKLYGLKSSGNEITALQNVGSIERAFNMAVFSMTDYPDSEKESYGKANAQKFIKYDMSVITCSEKSQAETVVRRLSNNEITFSDAVSEYSSQYYSDANGRLLSIYQHHYELERIIKDENGIAAISALAKDETSGVIETNSGFSIFHADEDAEQPDFENADTLNVVSRYLTSYESGRIEDYFMNIAQNFAAAAAARGFDAACTEFDVVKTHVESFPLNYGSVSIANSVDTSIAGLAGANTNENFLQTAFSLQLHEVSSPLVNGRNVLVIQLTDESIKTTHDDASSIQSQANSYDEDAASEALMASPKLKDNFLSVFINNFMNFSSN